MIVAGLLYSLAAVIYGLAADLGLRIDHDIAVTGFDGSIAAELNPTLTSVSIPVDDIAERMVAMALRQVGDGSGVVQGEVVEAPLLVGESTGTQPGPARASQEPASARGGSRSAPVEAASPAAGG